MIKQNCDYYPCHFIGQDCTFCYCPFYPCNDTKRGGKVYNGQNGVSVWDCSECKYIHRIKNFPEIIEEIIKRKNEVV